MPITVTIDEDIRTFPSLDEARLFAKAACRKDVDVTIEDDTGAVLALCKNGNLRMTPAGKRHLDAL